MGKTKRILIFLFTIINAYALFSQARAYPYQIDYYPFINYDTNLVVFPQGNYKFLKFNQKMHRLVTKGEGRINIVQIGGSHIQADIYSNIARFRLQHFYPGLDGGRGFTFPYSVANTNNPVNLKVEHTGKWTSCRNIEKDKTEVLGLAGISVSTQDTASSIKMYSYKSYHHYDFNRIKVFYKMDSLSFHLQVNNNIGVDSIHTDSIYGYQEFFLSEYTDTLEMSFYKTDSSQISFTLLGVTMETDDPGIVYHSIGINGASIPSFLRCQLLENQMEVINPDLVVLSLGTNDAYGKTFDSEQYYRNYDTLIQRVIEANPQVAILISVPNDDYLYKRYPNKFTASQEVEIYKLAKKYKAGVWNLYQIMGGFNSSQTWYEHDLMKYDRIHFTKQGYILKGDLYFNALLKVYDNYIEELNKHKSLLDFK